MSHSPMMPCPECGRPWKILSELRSDDIVVEYMAAHDCDGMGVIRIWDKSRKSGSPYIARWEVTTEEGDYV